MTPEGKESLRRFFASNEKTNRPGHGVTIQTEPKTDEDVPNIDITLPPLVLPGDILNMLSEEDGHIGDSTEDSRPTLGRVTLKHVSTCNTLSGAICMTFRDTDAGLKREPTA